MLRKWKAFDAYLEKSIIELDADGEIVDINFNNNNIIHTMRKNQKKVYIKFKGQRFMIVSEPTGSGKSTIIKFVFADRLLKDENHKLLIAVPQSLIAKSFGRTILKYNTRREVEWDIGLNLCQDVKEKKSDALMKFLRKRKFNKGIHNRMAIITHYALAIALQEMTPRQIANYFKNTTLVIDEAHHVLYPDDKKETEDANRLGKIISAILEKGHSSSGIWLPTATFYRGDSGPILSDEQIGKFKVHHLPFDKHWRENIKYIESFEFNFLIYKNQIFKNIGQILREGKKKTIIYCPFKGNILNGKSKAYFKNRIKFEIKTAWPKARICDLVKVSKREKEKEILFNDITAQTVDSILTVRIFDEGSDWKYAEQAIDIAPSNSLRVQVQRMGRLWRDIPGKNHIAYYVLLPHRSKFKTKENQRNHFNDSFTALAGAMIINEMIKPVKYPEAEKGKKKDISPLDEAIPNLSKKQEFLKDVQIELIKLRSIKVPTLKETKETIKRILETKYGVIDKNLRVSNHVLKVIERGVSNIPPLKPTWKNQGIDLTWMGEAGYKKVKQKDMFDNLLMFGTAVSGVETFQEFREVYGGRKTPDEWVKIAEDLAKENKNILPSVGELLNTGYGSLVAIMSKYPEKFKHIEQNQQRLKRSQIIQLAEKLAKENGGILPSPTWLNDNGYNRIVVCMYKHTELFKHIKQERHRKRRSIEENIEIANSLARKHKGKLPSHIWLLKNGYATLSRKIRAHPDKFKHLQQDSERNSVDEWVKIAEKLQKSNKGNLPSIHWMNRNGYSGLTSAIKKYPNKFKHIKLKEVNEKTPEEWVTIAENLARKNKGVLPKKTVLMKNGYGALVNSIYTYPEKFSHIKQDKRKTKTIDEHVKFADSLAKKNGGALPNVAWLRSNGFISLITALTRYPDNFKHIKRERKIKTVDEHVKDAIVLAKKNGGALPRRPYLKIHHKALFSCLVRCPQKFAHIKQES